MEIFLKQNVQNNYKIALNQCLLSCEDSIDSICQKHEISTKKATNIYNIFQSKFKKFRDTALNNLSSHVDQEFEKINISSDFAPKDVEKITVEDAEQVAKIKGDLALQEQIENFVSCKIDDLVDNLVTEISEPIEKQEAENSKLLEKLRDQI